MQVVYEKGEENKKNGMKSFPPYFISFSAEVTTSEWEEKKRKKETGKPLSILLDSFFKEI